MSPTRRDILKASTGAVTAALVAKNTTIASTPEPLRIEPPHVIMVIARLSDGRKVIVSCDQSGGEFCVGRHGDLQKLDNPRALDLIRKQNEIAIWLALQEAGIDVESDAVPSLQV